MSKLVVVIICAGMTFGFSVGLLKTDAKGSPVKEVAAHNQSLETSCALPNQLDETLFENSLSSNLNGLFENQEYLKLKSELDLLKTELSELTKGTNEYKEKLSQINIVLGKISILAGELNNDIDITSERILIVSHEVGGYMFPSSSICGKIRYSVEDLF